MLDSDRGEWIYQRDILDSLLVSSISEGISRLPSIGEYILSEVVNGTINYAGGEAGQMDYQHLRLSRGFEEKLFKYFKSEIEENSRDNLDPKIKKTLLKLCSPFTNSYWETSLYDHFKGIAGDGICPFPTQSKFSFSPDYLERVQKEVIPSLASSERRDVEGIGKSMRKYIKRDLKFIGKTVMW